MCIIKMGLDMELRKRTILKDTKDKILKSLKEEDEYEGVAYWRKNRFIHEWFCRNFDIENCNEVEIGIEDLSSLIEYLKGDVGEGEETEIKRLNKIIEETDWENEVISYWAWW